MFKVSAVIRVELLLRGYGCPISLIRRIDRFSNGQIKLSAGGTYDQIKRMEAMGIIKAHKVSVARARGGKSTDYILTDHGHQLALNELEALQRFCDVPQENRRILRDQLLAV